MTSKIACRWAGRLVLAALAVTAGCATAPGSRIAADPSIGYWLAASAGDSKQKDVHAAKLAAAEYLRRLKSEMPAALHDLRAYRALLLVPVEVRPLFPASSPDLRGRAQAEIERVEDFALTHKAAGSIAGAQYCQAWADELARITPLMASLEEKIDQMVRDGEAQLKQGHFEEAERVWQAARLKDRDGANVLRLEKQLLVVKNKGALESLSAEISNNFLKRTMEMQKKFGSPASADTDVAECLAILAAADKVIAKLRDLKTVDGQKVASDEVDKALVNPERDIATLRGKCWAEQVRLLSGRRAYWAAYRYADERCKEAAAMAEHRRTPAIAPLMEAYGETLLAAVSSLVNQANGQLDQDASGIAITMCRMAEEILQFSRNCQIRIPDEVVTWEKRCLETRNDAQKKIVAAAPHRLLIRDFSPESRENQRLSALVLDRCAGLLSATNMSRFVTVEKFDEKTKGTDCVIACDVLAFAVVESPPVEIERAVLKIGRDIREVPNPKYNSESKREPKTIFSQEVYLYQVIQKQCAKRVHLQASLTAIQGDRKKSFPLIEADSGDGRTKLPGVKLAGEEEQLDVPFLGPSRTSATRNGLSVDPWPKAVSAMLSSDAEIADAMQKYAAGKIADALVAYSTSYPVDILAADAVRHARLGNKAEAANCWGKCLEYCIQASGGKTSSWIAQKDRMLSGISDLCKTTWKDSDPEVLEKMQDLWTEATSSALDAVVTQNNP